MSTQEKIYFGTIIFSICTLLFAGGVMGLLKKKPWRMNAFWGGSVMFGNVSEDSFTDAFWNAIDELKLHGEQKSSLRGFQGIESPVFRSTLRFSSGTKIVTISSWVFCNDKKLLKDVADAMEKWFITNPVQMSYYFSWALIIIGVSQSAGTAFILLSK